MKTHLRQISSRRRLFRDPGLRELVVAAAVAERRAGLVRRMGTLRFFLMPKIVQYNRYTYTMLYIYNTILYYTILYHIISYHIIIINYYYIYIFIHNIHVQLYKYICITPSLGIASFTAIQSQFDRGEITEMFPVLVQINPSFCEDAMNGCSLRSQFWSRDIPVF
jgi:hypothetical protein